MNGGQTGERAVRLDVGAEDLSRGLGRLVVAILDLVRDLLERQVLRRIEADSLSPLQVERLGQALLGLQERMAELRAAFGGDEDQPVLRFDIEDLGTNADLSMGRTRGR